MNPEEIDIPNSNTTVVEKQIGIYVRLFIEFFTIVGLLSVVTNSLLVFVILKYKKLRQEVTNIIILHLNIMEVIFFLTAPMILRCFATYDLVYNVDPFVMSVFTEISNLAYFCTILVLLLLINDWYLKLYYEHRYVKFCRIYKFLVACIYIFFLTLLPVTIYFAREDIFEYFHLIIMLAGYIFVVLYVIVLNIIHQFKKGRLTRLKRTNAGLVITNVFFLLWCFPLMIIILDLFGMNHPLLALIFFTTSFSSPIISFFYLFKYDDNFNIFLKKLFKCECNDYQNEILVDHAITYDNANGIQIINKDVYVN